ncbi:MAG: KH domain-containing protein [Candidatus Peregrinibacteria bacterium]|nr:KH domain-containing protein [Candidatus Peregrinibacteria bacterium]
MANDGADRDFIEYVVKQIVDEPDAVEVTRTVDELGVLITLKVGKFDMGKVIGKNGQTAKALRTLLRVIGSKINARVNLKIIEPEGGEIDFNGGGMGDDATGDDATGDDSAASDDEVLEEDLADQHANMDDDLGMNL